MKKKVLALLLVVAVIASLTLGLVACNNKDTIVKETVDGGVTMATEVNETADKTVSGVANKTIKIGAIMVGDATEGYTKAHMDGINEAKKVIEAAGGSVEIVWKTRVGEDNTCTTAIQECISQGCKLIISNSYGHQDYMYAEAAKATNSAITFIAMTGDYANTVSATTKNYKNAFTNVYQSRYVSGVVAGLKLKQLIADNLVADKNKNADGTIKIGYVGAFTYAEVVSGYTAFYLGIKSVVSNVKMEVKFTNSWFDFQKEYETAKALIADGCIIIGQHADSEGAPTACEEAYKAGTRVYSVGYNVDMLQAAPHAALTSATNSWVVYYTYAFQAAMKGETIATDWAEGYNKGAVAITEINGTVFSTDVSATVKGIVDKINDGTLKVFDASTFTVSIAPSAENFYANSNIVKDADGHVTSASIDLSYKDWSKGGEVVHAGETVEAIKTAGNVKYFDESSYRAAPYFALLIDGIEQK